MCLINKNFYQCFKSFFVFRSKSPKRWTVDVKEGKSFIIYDYWDYYAEMYIKQNKISEAIDVYEKFIQLAKNDPLNEYKDVDIFKAETALNDLRSNGSSENVK